MKLSIYPIQIQTMMLEQTKTIQILIQGKCPKGKPYEEIKKYDVPIDCVMSSFCDTIEKDYNGRGYFVNAYLIAKQFEKAIA